MYMNKLKAYDGTTTSETQPRKNITTTGKVDTSDMMLWIPLDYLILNGPF